MKPARRRSLRTVIHDLNIEGLAALGLPEEDTVIFHADGRYAPCRGCFQCWLKNAGFCVMKDSLRHMGALIGQSDPLVIVSRCCYGGYSSSVKAVLDRAIGTSLPFSPGEAGRPTTSAVSAAPVAAGRFYGDCTALERQIAKELAERNRLNLGYEKAEVRFFQNPAQLGGHIV